MRISSQAQFFSTPVQGVYTQLRSNNNVRFAFSTLREKKTCGIVQPCSTYKDIELARLGQHEKSSSVASLQNAPPPYPLDIVWDLFVVRA